MHEQSILDDLCSRLLLTDTTVHAFTLTCSKSCLQKRLENDIQNHLRTPDVLARSFERMEHYQNMQTQKIPTDGQSAVQVAQSICARLGIRV